MKKTKPKAYCKEDEIEIFERDEYDVETKKYVKISKMEDKFLITSPAFISMFLALITDGILIFYSFNSRKIFLILSVIYFSFFASLPFFNFIIKMIFLKIGPKSWKDASKTHAAIHMIINAYNKKGSTPTFDEIKEEPYTIDVCPCVSFIPHCITSLLFIILAHLLSNWIVILLLFSNIFWAVLLTFHAFGYQKIQRLFISKPTEKNIKEVLEVFESLDRWEEIWNNENM